MDVLYTGRVELTGGVLNVRSEPGGSVIGQIKGGEEVGVLADLGEWAEIAYGEKSGFVAKQYVRFESVKQHPKIVVEGADGKTLISEGPLAIRLCEGAVD